jgi:hypothetical protein
MGIKRYIVLALVFVVAVGLYVFSFNGQSFTLDALGFSMTLPVAAWVIVPLVALMVASVIHLMYYWMKQLMDVRAHKKDYETFLKSAKQAIIYEPISAQYKTSWFALPHSLLSQMELRDTATTESIENEELRGVIELVNRVRNGEFVELKKYKLSQDNPLIIQNQINRLNSNPKVSSEILRDENINKESELYQKAWENVISASSFSEIQKLNLSLKERDILLILKRYVDEEDALFMENEPLEELLKLEALSKKGLIEAAKILQKKLTPDGAIALFEKLYNARADASDAFLYLLFELQMIDRAREILENSDAEDFKEFKLLLFLRDHGKHCETSFFIK